MSSVQVARKQGDQQDQTSLTGSCTQAMLLTSYLKLAVADPNNAQLKASIEEVFERYSRCSPCPAALLFTSPWGSYYSATGALASASAPGSSTVTAMPQASSWTALLAGSWMQSCSSGQWSTWAWKAGLRWPSRTSSACPPGKRGAPCSSAAWLPRRHAQLPLMQLCCSYACRVGQPHEHHVLSVHDL